MCVLITGSLGCVAQSLMSELRREPAAGLVGLDAGWLASGLVGDGGGALGHSMANVGRSNALPARDPDKDVSWPDFEVG